MPDQTVNFGVIGCGLMGREFASASLRWLHLLGDVPRPAIIAACDTNQSNLDWFRRDPDTKYFYNDYQEMLKNPEIEAVYAAVPHHLHAKVYGDVIRAGKHLIGEKPFGLDLDAFHEIERAMAEHPEVLVRCSSEFPFYPAVQKMVEWYKSGAFGQIIEAKFAIKHSSDMDLTKPINWKRTLSANGEYGCMGDLGIHTQHLPFRLGIRPVRVSAQLANIAKTRPDKDGNQAPCETWDNAILLCDGVDEQGDEFPLTFEMKRMAPGCTNTVEYEIYGMNLSAKFSSDDPNAIHFTRNDGREQAWSRLVVGSKPAFPTITGSIFEFGFSDSLLQMFAAFVSELRGLPCPFACFQPDEAQLSHRVLTAALVSQKEKRAVSVAEIG
ncbi:MAG: Gfo/Idh/MocA family oxidoreductase [Christensenella sp.]|nr:Gfo/Idh/MocA family oxidoreductase [Christensenella sp.]